MFTVCVRDHMMIAHSLPGEVFGPAQRLHGATYVVDVEFRRRELDADGIVLDIGAAAAALRAILAAIEYRNLDDVSEFAGIGTTTEWLAYWVFERMCAAIGDGRLGGGGRAVDTLRVVLNETPNAWAAYEAPLPSARMDADAER